MRIDFEVGFFFFVNFHTALGAQSRTLSLARNGTVPQDTLIAVVVVVVKPRQAQKQTPKKRVCVRCPLV